MSISTLCSPSLPPTPVIFSHPSCPFFYPTHHPLSASFCPTRPSQTLPPPSPSSFTYERRKPASPSHPLALIPRLSLLLSLLLSLSLLHPRVSPIFHGNEIRYRHFRVARIYRMTTREVCTRVKRAQGNWEPKKGKRGGKSWEKSLLSRFRLTLIGE